MVLWAYRRTEAGNVPNRTQYSATRSTQISILRDADVDSACRLSGAEAGVSQKEKAEFVTDWQGLKKREF